MQGFVDSNLILVCQKLFGNTPEMRHFKQECLLNSISMFWLWE